MINEKEIIIIHFTASLQTIKSSATQFTQKKVKHRNKLFQSDKQKIEINIDKVLAYTYTFCAVGYKFINKTNI